MRSNPKSYARKLLSALCVLAVKTKPYLRALPVLSRLPYEDPRPHHRHRRAAIRERPLHIGHIAGAYLPADIYVRNLKSGERRCSLSAEVMSMARPSRCAH
jgi:hypothetical protein